MNKKIFLWIICAIALITLVDLSNVVGYQTVKQSQEELIQSDFEYCKEYLFETIIQILKNPDIKDMINSNYKPQRTIMPFRRNNMDLKLEHLELLYNMGLKMLDKLGRDKIEELMENKDIEKPDIIKKMDTIIMDNDELRERIYTLNEMNVKSETLDWEFPVLCIITAIMIIFFDNIIYPIRDKFYNYFILKGEPFIANLIIILTLPCGLISFGFIWLDDWLC